MFYNWTAPRLVTLPLLDRCMLVDHSADVAELLKDLIAGWCAAGGAVSLDGIVALLDLCLDVEGDLGLTAAPGLGGFVAALIDAIDSLAASIGPPGSASVMAIPATNGALTTRTQSSSGKSAFVVTDVSLHVSLSFSAAL